MEIVLHRKNTLGLTLESNHQYHCCHRHNPQRLEHHHCHYRRHRIVGFDNLESFRHGPKLLGRNRHHLRLHRYHRHRYHYSLFL